MSVSNQCRARRIDGRRKTGTDIGRTPPPTKPLQSALKRAEHSRNVEALKDYITTFVCQLPSTSPHRARSLSLDRSVNAGARICVTGPGDLILRVGAATGFLASPAQPVIAARGRMTTYPPGTATQVVALCQIRDDERRLDRIAFRLWWEGFAVDLDVIRGQLQAALHAIEPDFHRPADEPPSRARGIEGVMRRSFGQRRLADMITAAQRPPVDDANQPIRWDAPGPPSLDDMADSVGQIGSDNRRGPRPAHHRPIHTQRLPTPMRSARPGPARRGPVLRPIWSGQLILSALVTGPRWREQARAPEVRSSGRTLSPWLPRSAGRAG